MVKNRLSMEETQETQIQPLGQEDPLEEERATHSSILAWKIPWTGESGGLQSMGSQSDMTEHAHTCTLIDIVPLIGFSWSCLLDCAKGDCQAQLMWLPALRRGSM